MALHYHINVLLLGGCLFPILVTDLGAQVYLGQATPGRGSAYVQQVPEAARPMPPVTATPNKSNNLAGRPHASHAVTPSLRLPSVGAGSAAVVKVEGSTEEWPTVGKGVVSIN